MGFLTRSSLLDRMYCLEIDVSLALAPYARNAEVTVTGAGVLAFSALTKHLKLDHERVRITAKIKLNNRSAALNTFMLSAPGKSLWNEVVPLADAPRLIAELLVFGFIEPSGVDRLGALKTEP